MLRKSKQVGLAAGLGALIALAPILPGGHALGSAVADACPVEFIGARGSGEYPREYQFNMGSLLAGLYTNVEAKAEDLGLDIEPWGLFQAGGHTYNAVPVFDPNGSGAFVKSVANALGASTHVGGLGAYHRSVSEGKEAALAHLKEYVDSCSTPRIILAGYSQGAQVLADVLQTLDDEDSPIADAVIGAVFFGDPYFSGSSPSDRSTFDSTRNGLLGQRPDWGGARKKTVWSYCHDKDPICQSIRLPVWEGSFNLGQHFNYDKRTYIPPASSGQREGWSAVDDATANLARILGAPQRIPGSYNGALDVVFCIDSTGSMDGIISQVAKDAGDIAAGMAKQVPDHRFALIDYKDEGDVYPNRLVVPFTKNVSELKTGLGSLTADGGGDTPEAVYAAMLTSLGQPFRPGSKKIVIVMGDAPAKDPDPISGATAQTVIDKALAIDPGQVFVVGTDGLASDEGSAAVAAGTEGEVVVSADPDAVVAGVKQSLDDAAATPVAVGTPVERAPPGILIALSVAASTDPFGELTSYDWDFESDGIYDRTTADPGVQHAFSESATVLVRATNDIGLSGLTTIPVTIDSTLPPPPSAVVAAVGTGRPDATVSLAWQPGSSGGAASMYRVADASGQTIALLLAAESGVVPDPAVVIDDLTPGASYTFSVQPVNDLGAGPVTVLAPVEVPRAGLAGWLNGLGMWVTIALIWLVLITGGAAILALKVRG